MAIRLAIITSIFVITIKEQVIKRHPNNLTNPGKAAGAPQFAGWCYCVASLLWFITGVFKDEAGLHVSTRAPGPPPGHSISRTVSPEVHSKRHLEWKRAARVVFGPAADSSRNEPKRIPITQLAIKKEEDITSLFCFFLFDIFHTDVFWWGQTRGEIARERLIMCVQQTVLQQQNHTVKVFIFFVLD